MADPSPPPEPASAPDEGRRWTVGKVATVVVVLAMVGFWAWIFAGGPAKENPDRIADRAYVARLEDRCQALRTEIGKLPPAEDTPDHAERAAVLDQANAAIAAFIDDVAAGAPKTGDAAASLKGWLTDWRTYLRDRETYADRLRTDPKARLQIDETTVGSGDGVDKAIEVFAQVNEIDACATPGDAI
jgi:hypothetical protein